jgi:signal transduction histidine kinase
MNATINNQFSEAYSFMMDFTIKIYGFEDMRDVLDHIADNAAKLIENMGAVPAELHETFFDKYATSGKATGTGLGTYSAKLIAQTQQGDITMHSSQEQGTTLTVTLPRISP